MGDDGIVAPPRWSSACEMAEGRLFWTEEERVNLLAMLLENVGARRAVRLGNVGVWKAAIEEIDHRSDGE